MASAKAPVKLTGGGGFEFADRVAAFYFAQMLGGRLPLGPEHGTIAEVHFEVRDRGWLLDDLLLVLESGGSKRHCALSLKSNAQVTRSGFPQDFVAAIWEQRNASGIPVFSPDRDLLALGVAAVAGTVKAAWDQLLAQAVKAEPERLVARLQEEGQSSEVQRQLFASLQCPSESCPEGPDALETCRLVRSVRLLVWDFEAEPSGDEADAIAFCQSLLLRGDTETAVSLWSRLKGIAAEARAVGASYDLRSLLAKLRSEYELKDHPDFQADWRTLRMIAEESRTNVRGEIGPGIRIARSSLELELSDRLAANSMTALRGESGCGKSVLVAAYIARGHAGKPVIWLDPLQFDHPNQVALAKDLDLRHTIPELVTASASQGGLIVFDAVERLSTQAFRRATELIRASSSVPGQTWRVLVTCQPQTWGHLLRELLAGGVQPSELSMLEVGAPGPFEINRALAGVAPGVAQLLLRKELQRLLCNLKVLDWIVSEEVLRACADNHALVGETDVIDWIWNQWIGRASDKYARAGVLIKIGAHEGRSLTAFVSMDDLDHAERKTVGDLEQEGRVRVRHGTEISFTHDLLGDWARLQSLLMAAAQAEEKIRTVVELPRWHRAVRLYAQHLLEHENGARRWKEALQRYRDESSPGVLAADCFLDALIFAGNAEVLMEQVWPDLTADKGNLLRRFLKRFLYVATVPDPRVQAFIEKEDPDWSSATFRIPYVWYWHVPLRVLERHNEDVCRLSLALAAEICELWLRTVPPSLGGRTDAAKLAVKLAREAQGLTAEDRFRGDTDRKVYEALLHGSQDLPDEVSRIVLELSHRRDESSEITARTLAYQEKRRAEEAERIRKMPSQRARSRVHPPPTIIGGWGELREPAPDGPSQRVSESFQSAVLNGVALISLAQVKPAVACEVLLAVCIDEPKRSNHNDYLNDHLLDRDLGTSDWRGGYPPMYFRGPFLPFLRAAPAEGLDAILRLVNYATQRWAGSALRRAPADPSPDEYSLEIALPKRAARWTGNQTVLVWYRDMLVGSHSVASALMALEKWLYEELDQGRNVDRWIETILERSTSTAFAGLLIAVGLRTPTLFAGPLRPLLTSPRLYDWQRWQVFQEGSWQIGMSSWARSGERLYQEAVNWHSMPHRGKYLLDTANELFLKDATVQQFLNAQAQTWAKEVETRPNESLELLAARFDPKNYALTDLGDGRFRIDFDWPEHLRERTKARADAAEKGSLAITFPHRCRRILNCEETIDGAQVEDFWKQFRSLVDWAASDGASGSPMRRSGVIAGGVAVLVIFHRSWLKERPEREAWCLAQLRRLPPEERDELDTPFSIMDTAAEAFAAEAAIALCADSETNWQRELIARGIMAYHYSSTGAVMRQAFRQRDSLPADLGRTVNLMICWAGLRWLFDHSERSGQVDEHLERLGRRLLKAFAEKKLPVPLLPLERIARIVRRTIERIEAAHPTQWGRMERRRGKERGTDRKIYRHEFWLDTEVLAKGFSFLGSLADARDDQDRARLLAYHAAVLGLFLATMPNLEAAEEEVEGAPYEFDRWVLGVTAAIIPQLSSTQEARALWQPIMDIGPGGHYWVEDFLRSWFLTGSRFAPSVSLFAEHWREMIAYALDSPRWTPGPNNRSYYLEECSRELMGFGLTIEIISAERFIPVVTSLKPFFQKWAERWLDRSRSAAHFAHFLGKPAGRALLPEGIVWLNGAVQNYSIHDWREREMDGTLVAALRACWRHANDAIRRNPDLQRNFVQLLNTLCKRLDTEALALRTEIAQDMPVEGM